jgi:hypothetical protein
MAIGSLLITHRRAGNPSELPDHGGFEPFRFDLHQAVDPGFY